MQALEIIMTEIFREPATSTNLRKAVELFRKRISLFFGIALSGVMRNSSKNHDSNKDKLECKDKHYFDESDSQTISKTISEQQRHA